jgi:thioredoxin 1
MRSFPLVVALLAALVIVTSASAEAPPVFSKTRFVEARDSTKGNEKILLVKATAEWCGPCKAMDRTTWRDVKVVEWVNANGLAIQLDVDEHPALAESLTITAMPTMIAFRNGVEVDRVVGFKDAEELLGWVNDVKAGKTQASKLDEKVKAAKEGGGLKGRERYLLARELLQGRKFDEATEQYVWMWQNILKDEPAMVGVRSSFMARDMGELAELHKPAHEAFVKLRGEAQARIDGGDGSINTLSDWIVLNDIVRDQDATLAWFDRVKDDPKAIPSIRTLSFRLNELLLSRGRWADAGRIQEDPAGEVRREVQVRDSDKRREMEPEMRAIVSQLYRDRFGKLYASVLAAGRTDEAKAAAAEAIQADDSPEMRIALVSWALEADQARPEHSAWLDEAATAGADVAQVRADLKKKLGE